MTPEQTIVSTQAAMARCQMSYSVDCVIFGYDSDGLKILLVECNLPPYVGSWSLLGDFVDEDENVNEAARRVLKKYTGLDKVFLEQVATFGNPGRHPLGRVITTAYYSLLKIDEYHQNGLFDGLRIKWFEMNNLPRLAFDHHDILTSCHMRLRKSLRERPIGFELLPRQFTLSQLRLLYEVVLDVQLDKRNFRRKLKSLQLLVETGEVQTDVSHRPAKLYAFDHDKYRRKAEGEFHFEI